MTTTTSHTSRTLRRLFAGVLSAGLLFSAACGGDNDDDSVADIDPVDSGEISSPQLNGLEVTATGNVTEILDPNAFQIDKDGLGESGDPSPTDDNEAFDFDDDYFDDDYDTYDYYDYDYDYYDYDYYTDYDSELDEFDEDGVLVITQSGAEVVIDDAVQINGTLRYYEESDFETAYGLDLDDELYGDYEDQYVIVADSIKPLPASRDDAASGSEGGSESTTTTTTQDGGSTTTAPGSGTDPATSSTEAGGASEEPEG